MHIKINHLSHDFNGVSVLNDINFDGESSSLAVIGPSGGGKSTLLRILGGLIYPKQGEFFFNGKEINYQKNHSLYKNIGYVFQHNGLFPHLSGLDNVVLPLVHVHGIDLSEAKNKAQSLLDRFNLLGDSHKFPYELSGGQQQRIAIARAIAPRPELLLLDEPTSALDPEYTAEVLDMIYELKLEGLNMIIVTHEMSFASRACDKGVFLAKGQILECSSSKQFFSSPQDPILKSFLNKVLEWNDFPQS
ncbi:MAG: amino acid ABC transporter ATP-binding protein [Brevinema sp.]